VKTVSLTVRSVVLILHVIIALLGRYLNGMELWISVKISEISNITKTKMENVKIALQTESLVLDLSTVQAAIQDMC